MQVPVSPQFCKVSSQGYHTLAVTCSGSVYAWGRNENLQLGQPVDLSGSKEPIMVTWFENNGYKCTNVAAGLFFDRRWNRHRPRQRRWIGIR